MDNRTNTIVGWVLFAFMIALGGSILSGEYFHPERPHIMGYPIEGVTGAETEGAAAAEQPIATFLAAADPAKGEQVFKKCVTCHTIAKGGPNGAGPNLWGTLGSPIGHVAGFPYSSDLKALGGNWDWEKLSQWVKSPRGVVAGTKMSFAGLGKAEDRANLLAYLNAQSDSPLPLPAAPAAAPAAGAAAGPAGGEDAPSVSGNAQQTKVGK